MYDRVSIETYEMDQEENIFQPQDGGNDDQLLAECRDNLMREVTFTARPGSSVEIKQEQTSSLKTNIVRK